VLDELESSLIAVRPKLGPTATATLRARTAALAAFAESHRTRGARRPLTKRVAVLVAAAAVIGAPAYAITTGVIDFWSQKPAPSIIKKRFDALFVTGAPPKMDPQALVDETRLVTVFKFGDADFPLWVAPTATGRVCAEFLDFGGGCTGGVADWESAAVPPGEIKPWLLSSMVGGTNGRNFLAGVITAPEAARLDLSLSDGTTRSVEFVWVSAPINAGFYMTELPASTSPLRAVALRLFDDHGQLLTETHEVHPATIPASRR
jgi:hypothetical protein